MALRRCGQVRAGATQGPDLMNDGLMEAQAIYDGWAAERTMNFTIPDYVYPITGPGTAPIESGQVDGLGYSIGTANNPTTNLPADLVGPRPNKIIRANLIFTNTSPYSRIPISLIGAEQWAGISVLQLTPIDVATVLYYEPTFPNGTIWLWPPISGNSIEIFTWGFLSPPMQLGDDFLAPPGYLDAIVYNLAGRMWPMLDKSIMVNKVSHQYLLGQAAIMRNKLKAVNAPRPLMGNDFGPPRPATGTCDWSLLYTGVPL